MLTPAGHHVTVEQIVGLVLQNRPRPIWFTHEVTDPSPARIIQAVVSAGRTPADGRRAHTDVVVHTTSEDTITFRARTADEIIRAALDEPPEI